MVTASKKRPGRQVQRRFSGEGLVFVYNNRVYFIGEESLAQYRIKQATPGVVRSYVKSLRDEKRGSKGQVSAAYTPMLHIMEGGG
jgi:hypothetical protein